MSRKRPLHDSTLSTYYKKTFPVDRIARWLGGDIDRRELMLWYDSGAVSRWRVARSKEELRDLLITEQPVRLELGAVYVKNPCVYRNEGKPYRRELVFDIDMPDYDDLRTCCQGKESCPLCWKLVHVAIGILDDLLRDLGFEHLLWVYSGNKGVHCWVCDPRAGLLDDEGREAIYQYLSKPRDHPGLDLWFGEIQVEQKLATTDPLVLWPRLDKPVTTQTKHPLKAPFCVHPKTRRVCVPFDPNLGPLDVSQVPTADCESLDLTLFDTFLDDLCSAAPPLANPYSFGT